MKSTRNSAVTFAGAGALAILLASSAFADSGSRFGEQPNGGQPQATRTVQGANANGGNRSYRDNERAQFSGKISSFSKERDGYRVKLDRDNRSYWVPAARLRNGGRDLRVGLAIGFGGIFRGGAVNVDAVSYSDAYSGAAIQQGLVNGVVDRVDSRTGTLLVRDRSTGRLIDVSIGSTRGRGIDLRNVRRGDAVTLSGEWLRGNSFAAYRIDGVNSRR
jgi:hypothetical protein